LIQYARRHTLDRWGRLGQCYQAILADREAQAAATLSSGSAILIPPASQLQRELLATIDERYATQEIRDRAEQSLCGWCNPEMLRLSGEIFLSNGDGEAAASWVAAALAEARSQRLLAWELRAALTMTNILGSKEQAAEGRNLLLGIVEQFGPKEDSADLRRAHALIAEGPSAR
jgi:hypothetical protein